MVVITYFFEQTPMDVDNIPKPILDELKGSYSPMIPRCVTCSVGSETGRAD